MGSVVLACRKEPQRLVAVVTLSVTEVAPVCVCLQVCVCGGGQGWGGLQLPLQATRACPHHTGPCCHHKHTHRHAATPPSDTLPRRHLAPSTHRSRSKGS